MNFINVPKSFPELLKNYVKAAIRTQPDDIISWSAQYFKTQDDPCTPIISSTHKQDRTLFRILAFQLGTTVGTKERIEEVWSDLSLDFNLLGRIYRVGKFHGEYVDMIKFLGITFGYWTKSLKETILLCCEAFCKCLATDGYFLHVDVACKLYRFLAKLDCSLPTDNDRGRRRHISVDDQNDDGSNNNNNDVRKPLVKTSKSLDTSLVLPAPSSSAENETMKSITCTSLESIFDHPMANVRIDDDIRPSHDHVPGIGPSVSDEQVQRVFEYFKKCASDNGGYVYEFDIESDQCPQLDAVDNIQNTPVS